MAQPFSFGFGGDDIEEDLDVQDGMGAQHTGPAPDVTSSTSLLEPKIHLLDDLLSTLPDSISYSTFHLQTNERSSVILPRRELFDIRAQIMVEDDVLADESSAAGLLSDDLKPKIYEGGFKTWECSVDLAGYLFEMLRKGKLALRKDEVRTIELGAGTALPSALLLSHLLSHPKPTDTPLTHLILTDYNAHVLSLATVPNLLLTYASTLPENKPWEDSGELLITPDLITSFKQALNMANIRLSFISGAWGPIFTDLVREEILRGVPRVPEIRSKSWSLALASETIYSPTTTQIFTDTLLSLLSGDFLSSSSLVGDRSQAAASAGLVAAKRIYFGVGGSVDDFSSAVKEMNGSVDEVWDSARDGGEDKGVGRCILEVRAGRLNYGN